MAAAETERDVVAVELKMFFPYFLKDVACGEVERVYLNHKVAKTLRKANAIPHYSISTETFG
jgi:hypothetical protein